MRGINNWIRLLLEPGPAPLLFLIGSTVLALLGNAAYDLLKMVTGSAVGVLIAAGLSILLLMLILAIVRRVLKPELTLREVGRRPALVALVSMGKLSTIPALAAIKFHYRGSQDSHEQPVLRYCWLLASPKPDKEPEQRGEGEPFQSSWKNAQDLRAQYESLGLDVRIRTVEAEDPQCVFEKVEEIYREIKALGLRPSEVIADFTGGTKIMTAGMVLACTPADRDVQYMRPKRHLADGRADATAGSEPLWVDLSIGVQTERAQAVESL